MAPRSHEDAQWLVTNGGERHVAPGEQLIDESEAADTVYVVLEGRFDLLGGPAPERLGAGKVAGPPSITGRPARQVVADTHAVVWAIPRERLQAQIDRDGGMLGRFRKVAAALTLDWIRMLRDRRSVDGDRAEDAGAENEEVYRMIEGMLRGEVPDVGGPGPGGGSGRGGSAPGKKPGSPRKRRRDGEEDDSR